MSSRKIKRKRSSERPCGGCRACCITLPVDQLNKDPHVACKHCVEKGCGIYPKRPSVCRGFVCAWTMGLTPHDEAYRPDNLGVILHVGVSVLGNTMYVSEIWEGALEDERAQDLIHTSSLSGPTVLVRRNGTRTLLA